jgi:hypothetical protein
MTTKKLNISLTPFNKKKLVELAKKENRPVNDQIVEMMEFYLKYKDKVK